MNGAWKATVHGVAKSRTQLSDFTFLFLSISLNFFVIEDYPRLKLFFLFLFVSYQIYILGKLYTSVDFFMWGLCPEVARKEVKLILVFGSWLYGKVETKVTCTYLAERDMLSIPNECEYASFHLPNSSNTCCPTGSSPVLDGRSGFQDLHFIKGKTESGIKELSRSS